MSAEADLFVDMMMSGKNPGFVPEELILARLLFVFPKDKKEIARLSHDEKMEWYAHQFQKDPQQAVILFSTKDFKRFWKWHVILPLKLKRFYYRLKSGEIFKRYPHITEMKKKLRDHAHLI